MKLRYLTPLVLTLVGGVAWSVQSYLAADRALRGELRLDPGQPPAAEAQRTLRSVPTAWNRAAESNDVGVRGSSS